MITYIIGVVLFALGIGLTIALHEAGHMTMARIFGMRVRRYFIGFGPRIWSFRRGHTEYGISWLPLGGFCDIAGMTSSDPVTPEEAPVAMVNKPAWQRIVVLSGGVITNIIVAFIILIGVAMTSGIPDPRADVTPTVEETSCVADQLSQTEFAPCEGAGPAALAGIKAGDKITAVDSTEISGFSEIRDYVLTRPGQTVGLTIIRDGVEREIKVTVASVQRLRSDGTSVSAGAIGLVSAPLDVIRRYSPLKAVPAAFDYGVIMLKESIIGLARFPAAIPGVLVSIFGGERDTESPMSVIGASRIGGELVERSLWGMFWMMLASLNLFLAIFNLVPLPPLDGGHIAVVLYEKLRDFFRKLRGLPPGAPANYEKLLPLTAGFAALLLTVGAVVIVADVINPITLFE